MDNWQINKVTGASDRKPINKGQLGSPCNRRVSIVLLRAENTKVKELDRPHRFLEKTSGTQPQDASTVKNFAPGVKP